jgi:predicted DNA-binding antitoxin AbrB/MazE fold protein
MQKPIEAVYEDGVIKPLKKLEIEEGRHVTLLLLEPLEESSQEGYHHLVARRHPWRHQLYVKGRNLTVGQLVHNMRADQLLPGQAADRYDLPVEAIQEALAYYNSHRELVAAEVEAEKRYLREKGYWFEPEDLPG